MLLTHAPMQGATSGILLMRDSFRVSIHAPMQGATRVRQLLHVQHSGLMYHQALALVICNYSLLLVHLRAGVSDKHGATAPVCSRFHQTVTMTYYLHSLLNSKQKTRTQHFSVLLRVLCLGRANQSIRL